MTWAHVCHICLFKKSCTNFEKNAVSLCFHHQAKLCDDHKTRCHTIYLLSYALDWLYYLLEMLKLKEIIRETNTKIGGIWWASCFNLVHKHGEVTQ